MVVSAIPPALAASIYIPALVFFLVLVERPRPVQLALTYIGAATVTTIVCGLVAVPILEKTGIYAGHRGRTVRPWVDIATGVLLILFSVILARRPRRVKPKTTERREWRPLAVLLVGVAMYRPGLLYLTALNEIAKAQIGIIKSIVNVIVIGLIVMAPLLAAMVGYLAAPDQVSRWLNGINTWFTAHIYMIVVALAVFFGIFLIIRGLVHL